MTRVPTKLKESKEKVKLVKVNEHSYQLIEKSGAIHILSEQQKPVLMTNYDRSLVYVDSEAYKKNTRK